MKYSISELLSGSAVAVLLMALFTLPVAFPETHRYPALESSMTPDKVYVVFRNDDLSFYSDLKHESDLIRLFAKYNASPLFAIIPKLNNNHYFFENQPLVDSLLVWKDHGLFVPAMHGFTHIFNKLGEFKRLSFKDQDSLMGAAQTAFKTVFDTRILFCPPWNQLDDNTVLACLSNDISRISGFRGIPVHDSIVAFNATLNLFKGDLPSFQEMLEGNDVPIKNSILVILYHSSYDFTSDNKLPELESILIELSRKYHCEFADMDQLINRYPEYLRYINIIGLDYNDCIRQLNKLNHLGIATLTLQAECESHFNLMFAGKPREASKALRVHQIQLSVILLLLLTGIGLVIFILVFLIMRLLKWNCKPRSIYYVLLLALAITGIILQINVLAERPKWQLVVLFIVYIFLALGVVNSLPLKVRNKIRVNTN